VGKQISSELVTGVGRGAKFISIPIYSNIFYQLLGKTPFLGTLNLKLSQLDTKYVEQVFLQGTVFDNLSYKGVSYGGIITVDVDLHFNQMILHCVGVRPLLTSHDKNIIEVVSDVNIREHWELYNSENVTITFPRF
jgi:riboflavin kinase